jgi:hypothetical protein
VIASIECEESMSTVNHPGREVQEHRKNTQVSMRRRLIDRRDSDSRMALVQRVLAEFREMPCLRLTPPQAQRLFGMRSDVSARVIGSLVGSGQLRLDPDGRYAASTDARA